MDIRGGINVFILLLKITLCYQCICQEAQRLVIQLLINRAHSGNRHRRRPSCRLAWCRCRRYRVFSPLHHYLWCHYLKRRLVFYLSYLFFWMSIMIGRRSLWAHLDRLSVPWWRPAMKQILGWSWVHCLFFCRKAHRRLRRQLATGLLQTPNCH